MITRGLLFCLLGYWPLAKLLRGQLAETQNGVQKIDEL